MAPDSPTRLAPPATEQRTGGTTGSTGPTVTATPPSAATSAGLRSRWHRLTGFMSDGAQPNSSLFGEILDWLWVPMMVLMPVSILLTFAAAKALSHAPFDRALSDSTVLLAEQVKLRGGRVVADLPLAARDLLRADDTDSVYFQVTGQRGEYVAGDRDLPLPADDEVPVPGVIRFRNDEMRGAEVRIAYTWVALPRAAAAASALAVPAPAARAAANPAAGSARAADHPQRLPLVQVAETLDKRDQLADEIVKGVILPQFIILPFAAVLIWFGLARGLRPLSSLVERMRRRRPGDLSPIAHGAVPVEVEPLIDSINDLMRQLDGSLKGQQRFIANAAHQLRTPLAGIQMQTELARRQAASGRERVELAQSLAQMALATRRLVRMVNQLLALTRAEEGHAAGAAAPRLARLDLTSLARERVQHWVAAARDKQIDLGFEAAVEGAAVLPLWIEGNAMLLGELINNLVENALHYTPVGGTITLRLRGGATAVLEVEDNGIGIAPEERERVFERFYRVLGGATDGGLDGTVEGTAADGSGLGLAIVREIAVQHRAQVRIRDGALGRGTVFAIDFALADVSAPRERAAHDGL